MAFKYDACSEKVASRNSAADPPDPPGSRGSGARAAAPNPTSLAPGARMTVVKHTPSNYYINVYTYIIYIYIYINIYTK